MTKEKPNETVRLDKWLWAARFYKTRASTREMIEGIRVHYNEQRSKSGKIIELDVIPALRQGNDGRTIRIVGVTEQHHPAGKAAALYGEMTEGIEKREKVTPAHKINALIIPYPGRCPDRKERCDPMGFKYGESE